ncbi:uncharacterized protein [Typha angustifolia]|uniref:uncharacterized protein isoform X1 n=2 Tax=Typha angustifolia TaxID=59011 RepID=UPI003C2FF669
MDAIGWYGPLVDLSAVGSHLGHFVQLIVFVRRSEPILKESESHGGKLLKTMIQVGDDTRSNFSVSVWSRHIGSMMVNGDVILLQNVKIVKFRDVLEATTGQISSLRVLIQSSKLMASEGGYEFEGHNKFGETTRAKLRRVIDWWLHNKSALQHVQQIKLKNWKESEEMKTTNCVTTSEALNLTSSCNSNFYAWIGEILLPCSPSPDEKGNLFASKRLAMMAENKIVEDFISTGCKLCGSPVDSRNVSGINNFPLYCQKSSKCLHDICFIYRPFLLYVLDQTGQVPLLVKNKAAEILFGNITAEHVRRSYFEDREHPSILWRTSKPEASSRGLQDNNQKRCIANDGSRKKTNFYRIWLILIKVLLRQGENSPFHFKITVDAEKDLQNGRFELVSLTMPIHGANGP